MVDNPVRNCSLPPSLWFPFLLNTLQGDVSGHHSLRREVLCDLGDGDGMEWEQLCLRVHAELTGFPGTATSFPVEQGLTLP